MSSSREPHESDERTLRIVDRGECCRPAPCLVSVLPRRRRGFERRAQHHRSSGRFHRPLRRRWLPRRKRSRCLSSRRACPRARDAEGPSLRARRRGAERAAPGPECRRRGARRLHVDRALERTTGPAWPCRWMDHRRRRRRLASTSPPMVSGPRLVPCRSRESRRARLGSMRRSRGTTPQEARRSGVSGAPRCRVQNHARMSRGPVRRLPKRYPGFGEPARHGQKRPGEPPSIAKEDRPPRRSRTPADSRCVA